MHRTIITLFYVSILLVSCGSPQSKNELKRGIWRATLTTRNGAEIPFNFDVVSETGKSHIEILSGDNRFRVDSIAVTNDSLTITMPLFGGSFGLKFDGGNLEGEFVKGSYAMPCTAVFGQSFRFFENPGKAPFDVSGRWRIQSDNLTGALCEWKQTAAGKLTGSVLTPSGDFRYFEGCVTGDSSFYVSAFDGGFVMLLTGKLANDSTLLDGKFYSGYSNVSDFTAFRDEAASLPDAYKVTSIREGETKLSFSFPDLNGNQVSIDDERFRGKPAVVQIGGSWCPNCLDETSFLSDFYDKQPDKLSVILLTFERSSDYDAAKTEALKLVKRCNVKYDVLVTGRKPAEVSEALPELVNFKAFPTTIVLDKQGNVRQIHSGFSGPGADEPYKQYVQEFTELIDELAKE